jgi:hypothetical protein
MQAWARLTSRRGRRSQGSTTAIARTSPGSRTTRNVRPSSRRFCGTASRTGSARRTASLRSRSSSSRAVAQASVVFVYIAEAYSSDGWQMPANLEEDILIAQHTTAGERRAAARGGVERLGLTMRVLVDDMDNAVSEAFAARADLRRPEGRRGRVRGPPGAVGLRSGRRDSGARGDPRRRLAGASDLWFSKRSAFEYAQPRGEDGP